jgi:rhamnose transport system permease protein
VAPDLTALGARHDAPASPTVSGEGPRSLSTRLRPLLRWETGLLVVLAGIILFGRHGSPHFLTAGNFFNLGLSVGDIAIMTLPMTLIVISGEIDLSVASTLGMSSAMLGYLWSHGWSMPAVLVAVLVLGAVAGAINGLLVTRLELPSLAVTIGTLALYRGVALILLGPNTVSDFPARYTNVGIYPIAHSQIPYNIAIFAVLAIVFGVVLHMTPFGRSIFAMGANKEAALFAGIRVKRIKTTLYVISGMVCAVAGMLTTFRLSTAVSNNGAGQELSVVAIVLFAGVSIFGGKGSIIGVVLAVVAFGAIQNALLLTNFDQRAMGVVTGGLLLVSVLVPNISSFVVRLREALGRKRGRSTAAGGS